MQYDTMPIRLDRLYSIRKSHHYTQSFIADYLNVTRQCYTQYEKGRRTPDLQTLIKLASLYHVSIEYLIQTPKTNAQSCNPCFNNLYRLGLNAQNHSFLYLNATEAAMIEQFRCINEHRQKQITDYIFCSTSFHKAKKKTEARHASIPVK